MLSLVFYETFDGVKIKGWHRIVTSGHCAGYFAASDSDNPISILIFLDQTKLVKNGVYFLGALAYLSTDNSCRHSCHKNPPK